MTKEITRVRDIFEKVVDNLREIDPTSYTIEQDANKNIEIQRNGRPVCNFSALWVNSQHDDRIFTLVVWYLAKFAHCPPQLPKTEASKVLSPEERESFADAIRRITRELS